MSKKKADRKNVPDEFKLSKKYLDKGQRNYYEEQIGVPNMEQNWLELFDSTIIGDLFTIMNSCSDNQLKSDYVTELLEPLGFADLGLGTNILTMVHPVYPGVVFKIALDEYGVADNFNDCVLQDVVPHYARVFARHPSSIVSVQQRYIVMTQERMQMYYEQIISLLNKMKDYFLIADLSPDMFLNYGIDRNGDFVIIDGSDLYPLHQIKGKVRCKRIVGEHKKTGEFKYCEGKLKYTRDFKSLICEKCGREYNPLELRPRKDVDTLKPIMSDGFTKEERQMLEQRQLEAIRKRTGIMPANIDREDDEDEDMETPREVSIEEFDAAPDSNDNDEPRTIFVPRQDIDDDDDEDMNQDEDPDDEDEDEGIVSLRPRKAETLNEDQNAHVASEPEESKEDATTDEDGESEDEQDTTEEDTLEYKIQRFTAVMTEFKEENPEEYEEYVKILIDIVGIANIRNYVLAANEEIIMRQTTEFSVVANEVKDNNIHEDESDDSESRIRYRVVEEDGNPSSMSGIYLDIRGDFDEAYDEYGLPIFITVDRGKTFTMAVTAGELKKLMEPAVEDAREELQLILSKKAQDTQVDDDPDEEDDTEDVDYSKVGEPAIEEVHEYDPMLTHKFFQDMNPDDKDDDDEDPDEDDED